MVKVVCWNLNKVCDTVTCNIFSRESGQAERAAQDNPKTWASLCQGCPLLVSRAFTCGWSPHGEERKAWRMQRWLSVYWVVYQCKSILYIEVEVGRKKTHQNAQMWKGSSLAGKRYWNKSFKSAGRKVWCQIQLSTELGSLARFWIVFSGDL